MANNIVLTILAILCTRTTIHNKSGKQPKPHCGCHNKPVNGRAVHDYSTRGVVSWLIKHSASPRDLSDTRPLLTCCKSRTALCAHINYNIKRDTLAHKSRWKTFPWWWQTSKTSATLQLWCLNLNLKLVGMVIWVGRAAPLVRSDEPVTKIKTTKINFKASFQLFTK